MLIARAPLRTARLLHPYNVAPKRYGAHNNRQTDTHARACRAVAVFLTPAQCALRRPPLCNTKRRPVLHPRAGESNNLPASHAQSHRQQANPQPKGAWYYCDVAGPKAQWASAGAISGDVGMLCARAAWRVSGRLCLASEAGRRPESGHRHGPRVQTQGSSSECSSAACTGIARHRAGMRQRTIRPSSARKRA